jgi:hypothetical protein
MSNGTLPYTTCRDANGHLLLDFNHDGEIDQTSIPNQGAFHEHSARGLNNQLMGNPFTNFWFDDNWLARYMSQAYSKALPYGLSEYQDFTRWRILGGHDVYWKPYGSDYFDTLALDGLYYITVGDLREAAVKF